MAVTGTYADTTLAAWAELNQAMAELTQARARWLARVEKAERDKLVAERHHLHLVTDSEEG